MVLNTNMVEQLAEWCLRSDTLADRATARRDFFGYDEPGEARYMEGAGDVASRERRFLGWFALTFKLSDGRSPAEVAATAILSGSELTSAINSIKGSRYVLAMVAMVNPGRGLILRLEDEEFTVSNRQLSRLLNRDDALCAHIIPAGRRGWLVGPGWLQWKKLVLSYMKSNRVAEFAKEIADRAGEVNSVEDLNKWLGLAMNIWNNTPQPDRGGKSPFEISREYDIQSGD